MRIDIAAQSDVGRRKKNNEDSYGVVREGAPGVQLFQEGAFLCVADGLGGHIGGEIASKLAVTLVREALKEPCPPPPPDAEELDEQGPIPVLRDACGRANENIYRTNQDLITKGRPMGTTLLAAVVMPKKAYLANAGDSRAYHIRESGIIARTEDHSWVDEQVKQGLMSKDEAEKDARKNVVTRCIGTHPQVEIDTYTWHIVPGDMLLLCTDGLVNMVRDTEISAEFRKGGSPAEIAHRLVALANENGGKDNITVVVADIEPSPLTVFMRRFKAFLRGPGAKLFWVLAALLYGGLWFLGGLLTGRSL